MKWYQLMKSSDLIQQKVKSAVLQILPNISLEDLSNSSNLFSLGLDSVNSMELLIKLQDTFNIKFKRNEINLENFQNITTITKLIDEKQS